MFNASPDENDRNARCLLAHIEVVRRVLRRMGFSDHAIEQAITVIYRAAMPYITGRKLCVIQNRRAWVFKVAIRAARRAAARELRYYLVEPAIMVATTQDVQTGEVLFDLDEVLRQLTELQREAIERFVLRGQSIREAARIMGICPGTLSGHLSAAKKRLEVILAQYVPYRRAA
jgi:DNA-directed RNA polymerase specialized sigma24 family protein